MLALVMAILWMPLAVHCEIESLLGVELCHFAEDAAADHDSDKSHTGCDECSVCLSAKGTPQFGIKLDVPKVAILPTISPSPPSAVDLSDLAPVVSYGASPPGPDETLPHVCLLMSRTALPVRAPSFAS
jgi:hypothetical protein